MARLLQTTNAKERIYAQSITFFSTNDSVLTALKASFTGMFGLHESTATLNAMKEGVSKSLEPLSVGGRQGAGGGGQGGVRSHHSRRRGQEARRLRDHVSGAVAADHRRDAQGRNPELGRDP